MAVGNDQLILWCAWWSRDVKGCEGPQLFGGREPRLLQLSPDSSRRALVENLLTSVTCPAEQQKRMEET